MYDIFKRTKRGSSNESGRKLVYVQQEIPSKAEKIQAPNKSLRKILKTSMPPPKPILRNPLVIPQKSMPLKSNRSPREVQIHNSYPGGVRVIRLNQDHAKPMLVYRPGPPRPTYTQTHLPNTVPHLRLGDYRPKIVNGYFSPNNVRSMMDEFPVDSDTSLNSSESSGAIPTFSDLLNQISKYIPVVTVQRKNKILWRCCITLNVATFINCIAIFKKMITHYL